MAEAIEMCRLAVDDGTTAIVATPHMFDGVYDVGREQILEGVRRLRGALSGMGIGLTILPGADFHAFAELAEIVRSGGSMTVGDGGRYLMLELIPDVIPPRMVDVCFSLQLMGITPIISHPERNAEVQEDPSALIPLVAGRNLVQVTAASITGDFGGRAAKCSHELVRRRLAHLVASDAHSLARRPPGLSHARAEVERLLGQDEARRMFDERPGKIVVGEPVNTPEPGESARPRRKRMWAWGKR